MSCCVAQWLWFAWWRGGRESPGVPRSVKDVAPGVSSLQVYPFQVSEAARRGPPRSAGGTHLTQRTLQPAFLRSARAEGCLWFAAAARCAAPLRFRAHADATGSGWGCRSLPWPRCLRCAVMTWRWRSLRTSRATRARPGATSLLCWHAYPAGRRLLPQCPPPTSRSRSWAAR